ncbi:hypothetical protein GCM10022288_22400 [Gryllotalpicola kribbensis]|uniref:Glycosyltransferase 2-like domain-containing protein n=1 Tax=Gryllotalpicola kribbensis TaxID=993084 RepID=A0ABP8AVM7_9MICO
MPLVSVGVPVLNGEKYLEQTLEALAAQTLDDIEILISDNASVDRTREIAEAFAARDARFVVLPHTPRLGFADNWNRTLAAASGEYFMWNASDDLARPDHLRSCVDALRDRPDAVVAFSRVERINETGATIGSRNDERLDFDVPAHERVRTFFTREVFQAVGWGGVFRTERLRRFGGLPRLFGGDFPLGIRMAMSGPWAPVPRVLYAERVHGEQTTNMQAGDPIEQVRMFQPERTVSFAFPQWELARAMYLAALRGPGLASERWRAALAILTSWSLPQWRLLPWDLKRNAVRLLHGRYGVDRWSDSVRASEASRG